MYDYWCVHEGIGDEGHFMKEYAIKDIPYGVFGARQNVEIVMACR